MTVQETTVAVWAEMYAHAIANDTPPDSAEWFADTVVNTGLARDAAFNSRIGEVAERVKAELRTTVLGRFKLRVYQQVVDQITTRTKAELHGTP